MEEDAVPLGSEASEELSESADRSEEVTSKEVEAVEEILETDAPKETKLEAAMHAMDEVPLSQADAQVTSARRPPHSHLAPAPGAEDRDEAGAEGEAHAGQRGRAHGHGERGRQQGRGCHGGGRDDGFPQHAPPHSHKDPLSTRGQDKIVADVAAETKDPAAVAEVMGSESVSGEAEDEMTSEELEVVKKAESLEGDETPVRSLRPDAR